MEPKHLGSFDHAYCRTHSLGGVRCRGDPASGGAAMMHTDTAGPAALMPGERCPAPCAACGDETPRPCPRCATYGTHGGSCHHMAARPSRRRHVLYVEPNGTFTILPAGDPRRTDRYRHAVPLMRLNRPRRLGLDVLTIAESSSLKVWALWALGGAA